MTAGHKDFEASIHISTPRSQGVEVNDNMEHNTSFEPERQKQQSKVQQSINIEYKNENSQRIEQSKCDKDKRVKETGLKEHPICGIQA